MLFPYLLVTDTKSGATTTTTTSTDLVSMIAQTTANQQQLIMTKPGTVEVNYFRQWKSIVTPVV